MRSATQRWRAGSGRAFPIERADRKQRASPTSVDTDGTDIQCGRAGGGDHRSGSSPRRPIRRCANGSSATARGVRRRGGIRAASRASIWRCRVRAALAASCSGSKTQDEREGSVSARTAAAAIAERRLPFRQRSARRAARRAGVRARRLSLHPLPQVGRPRRSSSICRRASIAKILSASSKR